MNYKLVSVLVSESGSLLFLGQMSRNGLACKAFVFTKHFYSCLLLEDKNKQGIIAEITAAQFSAKPK